MIKLMKWAGLCAAALLMTGCASVQMAGFDKDADAKSFAVAPGKANLYVYRNEMFGAAIKMPVELNGRFAGETAAKTYLAYELDPGRYTLISRTENNATLELNLNPGQNYFVWQEVKMGFAAARSNLNPVTDQLGKAGVMESKLADVGTYYKTPGSGTGGALAGQKPAPSTYNPAPAVTLSAKPEQAPAAQVEVSAVPLSQSTPPAKAPAPVQKAAPVAPTVTLSAAPAAAGAPVAATTAMAAMAATATAPRMAKDENFTPGISSVTVENMAKKIGCIGSQGASRVSPKGPIELYRIQCENGSVFEARCELRQCKQL